MQVSWFFATTPIPQRPQALPARRQVDSHRAHAFWARAADRFVAWGERTRQRSNAALMQL